MALCYVFIPIGSLYSFFNEAMFVQNTSLLPVVGIEKYEYYHNIRLIRISIIESILFEEVICSFLKEYRFCWRFHSLLLWHLRIDENRDESHGGVVLAYSMVQDHYVFNDFLLANRKSRNRLSLRYVTKRVASWMDPHVLPYSIGIDA